MNENDMGGANKDFLTFLRQHPSLKIVLAGGAFDIIHPGHIHTLNEAKKLGDFLVVVIATDKTVMKMKKHKPLHNAQARQELVSSLSMVDLCIIGDDEDIFKTVDLIKPQIIALGYDQIHQEKFITEGCRKINLDVTVARLESPIPDISSSEIEKKYGENIHGI
jgi:cytidyltransferase-like protein|tara:strand:+ start:50 stop:541 length:492 start_codon:yes stop_codon:yes gene_type:complete